MEPYLSLLVEIRNSLEIKQWLPTVLEQQRGTKISSEVVLEHPDIHILNQADETLKIDQVRELQELSSYSPYHLPYSFFVIQNLETASIAAQNALLKIVEEPPQSVSLIISTAHPHKILATIRSRCQNLVFDEPALSATSKAEVTNEIQTLYQQILQSNPGELLVLAEMYTDKTQATLMLTQLIQYLHQALEKRPDSAQSALYLKHLKILLETTSWLEKNVNLKLAIAECFFQLSAK